MAYEDPTFCADCLADVWACECEPLPPACANPDCAVCLAQQDARTRAAWDAAYEAYRDDLAITARYTHGYGSHMPRRHGDFVLLAQARRYCEACGARHGADRWFPALPATGGYRGWRCTEAAQRTRYALRLPWLPTPSGYATKEGWTETVRCPSWRHDIDRCHCDPRRYGTKPQVYQRDPERWYELHAPGYDDVTCRLCGVWMHRVQTNALTRKGNGCNGDGKSICDACLPDALKRPYDFSAPMLWNRATNATPHELARSLTPMACCGHAVRAHYNDEVTDRGTCRICQHESVHYVDVY